jgi:hypothetical protein
MMTHSRRCVCGGGVSKGGRTDLKYDRVEHLGLLRLDWRLLVERMFAGVGDEGAMVFWVAVQSPHHLSPILVRSKLIDLPIDSKVSLSR